VENPFARAREINHDLPVFRYGGFYQAGYFYHIVSKNETLFIIAKNYLPFTAFFNIEELTAEIKKINNIGNVRSMNNAYLRIPIIRQDTVTVKSIPRDPGFFSVGFYLTAITAGSGRGMEIIRTCSRLGANTVIFDLKDEWGNVYIDVKSPRVRQHGAVKTYFIRDLPKLIHFAHQKKIHAVARVTVFADKHLAQTVGMYCLKDTDGNPIASENRIFWTDPTHPEVRQYNYDIIAEICQSGVDEIQLDYIRFPSFYGELATWEKNNIPRDIIITSFIQDIHTLTRSHNILLSVDVFGITIWEKEIDIQIIGQRLAAIAQFCDSINPMIYPSHFAPGFAGFDNPAAHPRTIIAMAAERLKTILSDTRRNPVIRPWIQAFPYGLETLNTEYIQQSIHGVMDQQCAGYYFWSPGNIYTTAFRALHNGIPGLHEPL